MLWLFKTNFRGFRRFLIHGNTSYVVLYTQCLRYNICSVWFLDIRISTCLGSFYSVKYSYFYTFLVSSGTTFVCREKVIPLQTKTDENTKL